MENVIYTTACGMFRVIEENGVFIPQERIVSVAGFGRLRTMQEAQRFQANGMDKVRFGMWEGWHLGYTQRNDNKGYKRYKSVVPAIKFVDRCSEDLQEVA